MIWWFASACIRAFFPLILTFLGKRKEITSVWLYAQLQFAVYCFLNLFTKYLREKCWIGKGWLHSKQPEQRIHSDCTITDKNSWSVCSGCLSKMDDNKILLRTQRLYLSFNFNALWKNNTHKQNKANERKIHLFFFASPLLWSIYNTQSHCIEEKSETVIKVVSFASLINHRNWSKSSTYLNIKRSKVCDKIR